MKFSRTLFAVAIAAAFSAALCAQQAPSGFHSVACYKVKPEKTAEFRKWYAEDVHKVQQSRADSGAITSWMLLRSVTPQGKSAECDYLSIAMFPGAPPEPMGLDQLGATLKKAGLAISAQEYIDRRNSLTELVSNNWFRNLAFAGSMKKGDYVKVNYVKVPDIGDWLAYEKKVWQPLAEAMIKDGVASGWSVNVQELPAVTNLPFQAVTVDVYPSWDAVFNDDPQYVERFKRVHPDMEFGTTFEHFEKLRTQVSIQLLTVEDMVTPAK